MVINGVPRIRRQYDLSALSMVVLFCWIAGTAATATSLPNTDTAKVHTSPVFTGSSARQPAPMAVPSTAPTIGWVGVDGGGMWSSLMYGPMSFYLPNPYWPGDEVYFFSNGQLYDPSDFAIDISVLKGTGSGYSFGGMYEMVVANWLGLQVRASYTSHNISFDESIDELWVHPRTETGLTMVQREHGTWKFEHARMDLLARVPLPLGSLYMLAGASTGLLLGNTASVTSEIVQPSDIYYTEAVTSGSKITGSTTDRLLRSASSTHEVNGLTTWRFDLKAGIGWLIHIDETMSLAPELTITYPLGSSTDPYYFESTERQMFESAAIVQRTNSDGKVLHYNDGRFNNMSIVLTIGLRFRLTGDPQSDFDTGSSPATE